MNNAKLWLVVKPTVGIPLFLAGVGIGSFAVHLAVLSKTTWYEDYLIGAELGSGEGTAALSAEAPVRTAGTMDTMTTADGDRITVIMPDGTRAVAVIEGAPVLADARPASPARE